MDIIKSLLRLVGISVLSLFAAATFAAEIPIEYIDDSANGTQPTDEWLKDASYCPDGIFLKNLVPGLTNGSDGGSTTVALDLAGEPAAMTITWGPGPGPAAYPADLPENAFGFSFEGAYAQAVGVTTNTNSYHFNYRILNATAPVQEDSNLNKLTDAGLDLFGVIADVNHLDLCLVAVDDDAPFVSIDAPLDGAEVSGDVRIIATISDDSGLDPLNPVSITIVNVDTNQQVDPSLISAPIVSGNQFTWTLYSSSVDVGLYRITVTATDGSVLANVGSAQITVEIIDIGSCLGVIGDEDLTNPTSDQFGGGCTPSIVTIQAAPDYNPNCVGIDTNETCTINGELLEADDTSFCGPGAFRDPRMSLVDGKWVPTDVRELVVFDELGGAPVSTSPAWFPSGVPIDALVLDEYTYGYRGCFGVVFHYRNFLLTSAYPEWPDFPATGLVFVKTVFPEIDWVDPAYPDREVAKCYGEDGNFDLQEAAEFAYQTDWKTLMIGGTATPYTNACGSARTLTRDKSFEVFNVIETAGIDFDAGIDPETGTTGREKVLQFKYDLAAVKFVELFAVLDNAEPTLLTGRYSAVTSKVNQAKRQFENRTAASLDRAIGDLRDASDVIKIETTWTVNEENWPGDALGRIENLIYRLGLLKLELERP